LMMMRLACWMTEFIVLFSETAIMPEDGEAYFFAGFRLNDARHSLIR
jgi:hypothetical protein